MNFLDISHINDIQSKVIYKPEIRWMQQKSVPITVGCYMYMDSHTFDEPAALECRGISFDDHGRVLSRPLHKFFNVGEKMTVDELKVREEMHMIAHVFEKLDGSIISTSAMPDGSWAFRSRKSYDSDVVKIATALAYEESSTNLRRFCKYVTDHGLTACFELTSPEAQIVLPQATTRLRLLHVRDNFSGEYVLLDPDHPVHDWIDIWEIEECPIENHSVADLLRMKSCLTGFEGWVIQFTDGDMVKLKTDWYSRLHKSISFMRERDIARLALRGELDDVRDALAELKISSAAVDAIETKVKNRLVAIELWVNQIVADSAGVSRKDFAIANKHDPLFSLMINRFIGKAVECAEYYEKHHLEAEFTLNTLIPGAGELV